MSQNDWLLLTLFILQELIRCPFLFPLGRWRRDESTLPHTHFWGVCNSSLAPQTFKYISESRLVPRGVKWATGQADWAELLGGPFREHLTGIKPKNLPQTEKLQQILTRRGGLFLEVSLRAYSEGETICLNFASTKLHGWNAPFFHSFVLNETTVVNGEHTLYAAQVQAGS